MPMQLITRKGKKIELNVSYEATSVKRTILSVSRLLDGGNAVFFHPRGLAFAGPGRWRCGQTTTWKSRAAAGSSC